MNKITICIGRSCKRNFSKDIVKQASKTLKCELNDYSRDGQFELLSANCMNNCENGPSVKVNEVIYSHMTPKETKKIISEL